MSVKMSVSGTFIAKPYHEAQYDDDGSFSVGVHCAWNMQCIENEQEHGGRCPFSMFVLSSSSSQSECECQVIEVDPDAMCDSQMNGYGDADIGDDGDRPVCMLRVYPEELSGVGSEDVNEAVQTEQE